MSTIKTENGLRIQTSDAGKMLTNGETYSKIVYLGDGAVAWAEINESEVPVNDEELTDTENKVVMIEDIINTVFL